MGRGFDHRGARRWRAEDRLRPHAPRDVPERPPAGRDRRGPDLRTRAERRAHRLAGRMTLVAASSSSPSLVEAFVLRPCHERPRLAEPARHLSARVLGPGWSWEGDGVGERQLTRVDDPLGQPAGVSDEPLLFVGANRLKGYLETDWDAALDNAGYARAPLSSAKPAAKPPAPPPQTAATQGSAGPATEQPAASPSSRY